MAIAAPLLAGQKTHPALKLPEYWHLFSLDAPTIAALWAFSFARAAEVRLPLGALFLLALGTWLVYVADRILDGLRPAASEHMRARHFFYVRHRNAFLLAGSTGALLLLWMVATRMRPVTRREDVALFVFALVYFALVHTAGKRIEQWFPKEMAVGVLFAAATAVPAWSRTEQHLRLIPVIALFALLCWLNCVAIEKWEQPVVMPRANIASPHASTLWAQQHLRRLAMCIGCAAVLLSIFSPEPYRWIPAAAVLSAGSFYLLDKQHRRLSPMHLRIAADAALLSPLICIALLW